MVRVDTITNFAKMSNYFSRGWEVSIYPKEHCSVYVLVRYPYSIEAPIANIVDVSAP